MTRTRESLKAIERALNHAREMVMAGDPAKAQAAFEHIENLARAEVLCLAPTRPSGGACDVLAFAKRGGPIIDHQTCGEVDPYVRPQSAPAPSPRRD